MPPDAQAFHHQDPAAATCSRGVGRVRRDRQLPGTRCLESEDGEERRPAHITDALVAGSSSR